MTLFSAPTWQIVGVHRTSRFFGVISFTFRLITFISSLDALAELNDIYKDLGSRVEPFDDELFLSLLQE